MAFTPIAIKDANSTSKSMAAYQDANSYNIPVQSTDSSVTHYRAAKSAFSMVATPTAAFNVIGSATKTVRIKKIKLSGAATAAANMPVFLTKRSSAGTLGSAVLTALTAVPMDSGNAAGTATANTVGTANYTTLGTSVGVIAADRLQMTALTTGLGVQPLVWTFGTGAQALVLRGVAEQVTVDFGGTAIPSGGVIDIEVEWAEDAS